ncbi:putative chromodomain helicase dna binding protein [Phaeoacremonium minimum UCRPA7]|uniref:Putative chromodomain helicase dna binding protein n=1 Tax=Phaeoacremonium minimum (strain UCR-PA7) TaxID=1286976 RepID=R8BCA1_PHAM7|nr:putative chromodomain helicase dna binding protein [Phaeoacremonium minimum UCRPA7]EON96928.1 putative chromodomain helicase dna binding protein [Phaeoacremonium minimum UCRPA7]
MSSSPELGPANGHSTPVGDNVAVSFLPLHESESDLSEVQAATFDAHQSSESPNMPDTLNNDKQGDESDHSSEPSDNDASDDADFDMADSPISPRSNGGQNDIVVSDDSQGATKRKAAVVHEDDYMRENPELYGLRRSTRPQQRRKIVDSDDESESDDVPVNRRTAKRRRVERSQPSSKRDTPIRQTSADDSDSDTYGGARARSFQKKARRQQESQPALAYAEKRWTSRRAAQVSAGAYNESDVDDENDSDLTPAYWVGAEMEDNSPYIEKVIRHRPKEGVELTPDATRHDFEYYIKWQGKSHLHDTWETTATVAGYRGFRRLENYYKKIVEFEVGMRFDEDEYTPEQREQWLLDREREEEAHEDYTKVERVVAIRDGDEGDEYLIKWKGLQYDECTWEAADLVSSHAQDKIDQFIDRSSRSWQSDRKEANPDTRSRMTKLEKQPSYIKGGELREFQMKGLNFLALNWTRSNNVILADEMGLGKTVQSVAFLSWLRNEREQEGPFLVVAPLSVIPAWCDTFNHWAPDINYVVYLGPEAARSTIREHELLVNNNPKKPKFNVLVTSYDYILLDADFLKQIKWQVLAVDEAHRLKNRESQLYAKLMGFGVPCKVLITGTPIQNNLAELSALLDFLNPGKVLIDEELEQLGQAEQKEEDADKDEEKRRATQEKLSGLHRAIAPFILRRTKEIVESDLPPKTEKIIRVELSDVQLDYYKNILTRNYAALSDASNGHKQSLLNIMMELKKVSNHPYMFHGAEERVLNGSTRREDQIKGLITSSGKMMLLDQLLTKLKKDNHRVLIFSQMVKMLDILGDYLRIRGYQFQRLDGTIPAGPRRMAINHFNADNSEDFCFLLSTRAGGLGINLMTADTVIIYDSDWNPQADLQAMARAHRIGQKRPVSVYRLVAKQTIEEEVVKRARNKLFLEYLTIQAGVTDEGKALREQFKERGLKMDEAKTADDIQWILKMRSQNLFEQSGNQEKLEQLDIDSILENAEVTKTNVDDKINLSSGGIDWDNWMQVTDVKVDEMALDWDQIIPSDQLATIKAEEEKKKHEEYLAKALEENAPRRATLKNSKRGADSERAERLAKKRQRERQEQEELEEQRAQLSDPKRPLNEKETRNLIRAFFRYGSLDDRGDEVVQEARLTDRDRDLLRSTIDELVGISRVAVDANSSKLRDEEERTGKVLAKKDKKAVLVDFGEVRKVNAETVVDRPPQLRLLRKVLTEHGNNQSFRLPDATKAAHYSCEWGAREDGMLLVGIDKYGFGAWTQIRDDPDLQMEDKFFLEEHRVDKKEERKKADDKSIQSPGAVHLVRRAEYLLSVLLAKYSNDAAAQRAVENHHRSKKNLIVNGHRRVDAGSHSASPAPQLVKKSAANRDRNPTPTIVALLAQSTNASIPMNMMNVMDKNKEKRQKLDPETLERLKQNRDKAVERFNELMKLDDDKLDIFDSEQLMWSLLKPVRPNFERIMYTTADKIPSAKERAKIMGTELRCIGKCLTDLKKNKSIPADKLEDLMPKFWDFLSTIWPIGDFDVSGKRLSRMYRDLSEKDKKDAGEKADKPKKRDDLEDGEIDDEEEARRQARRDARREISEDVRREYRRDDYKHRAYENGDRLSFRKDRGLSDRGRQTWLSPNPRHSPY